MSAPFPNIYTHRKVAEGAAKACDICYKPSTSVLITPDQKDFFYVCLVHLKDRYFCTPKIDEDALKAERERQIAEETEKLKKAYEERQRKKKEKESKIKDQEKDTTKEKDSEAEKEGTEAKTQNSKDADKDSKKMAVVAAPQEAEPRVYEIKSAFYQQRLQRKRQVEAVRRDRERATQPNYFPSVPTDMPGK